MTNSPDANPLPTAGLIRRLLALVYDSLLLLGVTFAYGVLIWIIRRIAGDDTLQPMGGSAALLGLLKYVVASETDSGGDGIGKFGDALEDFGESFVKKVKEERGL